MSLLIKGVQVIDGTGKEAYRADVLVQKDIISSIGNLKERGAKKVIEGLGNYLVPGFIDVHARSDHYFSLFSDPQQTTFIEQGITSVLGGTNGVSLAPLLYGTPSSIEVWSDTADININWHTLEEFLTQLDKRGLGINFGTLVGHSTLRRDLAGDRKTLDSRELTVLKRLIEESLGGGAYGVSSDLSSAYGSGITSYELNEIAKIVREFDAVYMVSLRDAKRGLKKSVQEIIRLAQTSRAKIVIEGLRPTVGYTKEFREAINVLRESPVKYDLHFLLEPFETREVPIHFFLPKAMQSPSLGAMLARVRDVKNKNAIRREIQNYDLRSIRIASAPRHHFLIGKSIKQVAENWDIDYIDAIRKIADMSDLTATVFYDDISASTLRSFLGEEKSLITADSSGIRLNPGRAPRTNADQVFVNFLRGTAREGLLSLEEAIKRITSVPAKLFGIRNRGLIDEGMSADLAILSKDNYEVKTVVLGGKVFGEDKLRGEVLDHYR
ncbi:MAG: amidohydrolase family protein [Candidatus Colwellbacteria bacterium]|nr:amidohydrolase family protein [Candidatus Colwellbacteria bacterium]